MGGGRICGGLAAPDGGTGGTASDGRTTVDAAATAADTGADGLVPPDVEAGKALGTVPGVRNFKRAASSPKSMRRCRSRRCSSVNIMKMFRHSNSSGSWDSSTLSLEMGFLVTSKVSRTNLQTSSMVSAP
eukprot:Skav212711  [mRNA]  locus=scaffold113:161666:172329:+ [translate_table: standard]